VEVLAQFVQVIQRKGASRMAARDGSDPADVARASERHRRGQEIGFAEIDPKARADIIIDNRDFAAPKLVAMRSRAC
jgi:hypothetical protein